MSLPGLDVDAPRDDLEAIRSWAAQFRGRSAALDERAEAARGGIRALSDVVSLAADGLRPRIAALADRFERTAVASEEVAGIVDDYATALDSLLHRSSSALSHAHFAYDQIWIRRGVALNAVSELVTGWALAWDDVLPSWLYLDDPVHLSRWADAIDEYRSARSAVLALQSEREELDHRTAQRLRSVALFSEVAPSGAGWSQRLAAAALWAGDLGGVTAQSLAALGDPDLIRQVWNALPVEQRDGLVAASALVIGNLDGIPLRDRVAANRINIAAEIERREGIVADLEAARDRDLAKKGGYPVLSESAINAAYDARVAEQRSVIASYRELLTAPTRWYDERGTMRTSTGARVVVFDPSIDAIATYHGAIDEATGDIPAWVRHVAISVPGTTARMTDFDDDRAAAMHADAGPKSAIFQWAGGTFPADLVEATDSSYANTLAPRLRDFAAGVSVPGDGTLTVMGHSYGGATVGLAEKAGLVADRVLYVSAAGMGHGVSGLADFAETSDVPHYSMMVRNDLIVGLVQGAGPGDLHGQSPLTADGVVRLETGRLIDSDAGSVDLEDYNQPGNGTPSQIDSHSTLFTPGSTAYDNMIAVITGGEAELYAPDEIIMAGQGTVFVDGIDRADYTPTYSRIE